MDRGTRAQRSVAHPGLHTQWMLSSTWDPAGWPRGLSGAIHAPLGTGLHVRGWWTSQCGQRPWGSEQRLSPADWSGMEADAMRGRLLDPSLALLLYGTPSSLCFLLPFPGVRKDRGARGAQTVKLRPSDFSSGHDLMVHEFEPHVGLCADGSEPGACFGSVSPSICPSPIHALSLSLKNEY